MAARRRARRVTLRSGMGRATSASRPACSGVPGLGARVLVTMRPKQWIKNALVVAAAGAAGALGHDDVPVRVGLACVAFCLLASGIYAINDVRDAPEDRLHPRKRHRPVAAGELDPRARHAARRDARSLSGLVALRRPVRPLLGLVALGLRGADGQLHVALRRIRDRRHRRDRRRLRAARRGRGRRPRRWRCRAGSCSWSPRPRCWSPPASARPSSAGPSRPAAPGGAVLARYGAARLRLIVAGSAAVALFAYSVWAFALPDVDGIPWRPLTIVPFAGLPAALRHADPLRRRRGARGAAARRPVAGRRRGSPGWSLFALGVHAAG